MSTRTIIEINHDYMHDLDDPHTISKLLDVLRAGFVQRYIDAHMHVVPGIRVLAQRHHSEKLCLKVE